MSGTLRARAHKGLRASRSRIARSVAIAIGIALLSPMYDANTGSIDAFKYNPRKYINATMNKTEATCIKRLISKESATLSSTAKLPVGRNITRDSLPISKESLSSRTGTNQVKSLPTHLQENYQLLSSNSPTEKTLTHFIRATGRTQYSRKRDY